MVTQKRLEALYTVYYKATEALRQDGQEGHAERLHEDFGHELSAWDAWYGDGQDPHERPDQWNPTMADLNYELKKYGFKAIGGKNPRVEKL
jgi:tRNA U34 5-methylaminomethyl-2-thiouridine-forming methyltransferase MnmC